MHKIQGSLTEAETFSAKFERQVQLLEVEKRSLKKMLESIKAENAMESATEGKTHSL